MWPPPCAVRYDAGLKKALLACVRCRCIRARVQSSYLPGWRPGGLLHCVWPGPQGHGRRASPSTSSKEWDYLRSFSGSRKDGRDFKGTYSHLEIDRTTFPSI